MTASVIGALRATLGLDAATYDTGLDAAERKAAAFGARMKTAFAVVATAAVASGIAVGAALKNAIDEADELSKSASKIGIPIEELSTLKYAADLAGVSMEGFSTGIKKLSANMAGAFKGEKAAVELFSGIGISVTDAHGKLKDTTTVLEEVSDKLSAMPDGAEKTALALKLLGKSGLDLIPLLNGGAAALREATDEAKALGLEISEKTGKAAEQFNDNLSRMGYAASGLGTQLAAALAPALAVASDGLVLVAKAAAGVVNHLPEIGKAATVAGTAMVVAFGPTILSMIRGLAVAIGTSLIGSLNAVRLAIASNPLGFLAVAVTTVVTAMWQFRDSTAAANAELAAQAAPAGQVKGLIDDLRQAQDAYKSAIAATASGQAAATSTILANTKKEFEAKKSLLELELKRQQAAIAVQQAELAQASNSLKADVGSKVATRNDSERLGFSDPRVGDFVRLPDSITGLDKTREVLDASPLNDRIKELKANLDLSELSAQQLKEALSSTFTDTTATVAGAGDAAVVAGSKIGGAAQAATDPWKDLRSATKGVWDEMDKTAAAAQRTGQQIGNTIGDAISGITSKTKTLSEALIDVLGQLASMWVSSSFQSLFGGKSSSGSGGSIGSGLIEGILGSLPGFANEGTILPGVDSQVVAFRKSPSEQVDIYNPNSVAPSGGSRAVKIGVNVTGANGDQHVIALVRQGVAAGLDHFNRNVLPGRVGQISDDPYAVG